MKLYIKKLKIIDDEGTTIISLRNEEAVKGLTYALKITKEKVGIPKGWKSKLMALDKEFRDYFMME